MLGWWWTDRSLGQHLERFIVHDERDARFGVPWGCAFVNFGLVLYVDCPGCFSAFVVLDSELEDCIGLEARWSRREYDEALLRRQKRTGNREAGEGEEGERGAEPSADSSSRHC